MTKTATYGLALGNKFTKYPVPDTLSITCMLEDKDGNLWFGAMNKGVYRYDGKALTNYTTADGLVNNPVVSILEDQARNLWFGTKWFGLSRYDGKNFTIFSQYGKTLRHKMVDRQL